MAVTTVAALTNQYQKYFSKKLLEHAINELVMDQFAQTGDLPKNMGAKTISFFRRKKSVLNSVGRVDNVVTLNEGTPITQFSGYQMDRIDVTMTQLGEATKITDIASWTELFSAMKQSSELMGEDCALNADAIVRDAFVQASTGLNGAVAGVTLNQASGTIGSDTTITEVMPTFYAQNAANFAALAAASNSAGKVTGPDFLRIVTKLKQNRAPKIGGWYVAIIPPPISADLQNDPDWISATNFGDPDRRFKGEIKNVWGCRFVEHTNPFIENSGGTEGYYAVPGTITNSIFRTWIIGKEIYGVPKLAGTQSPFRPQLMMSQSGATKDDPLDQFRTAGWKAYWAAQVLNAPFGASLSSRSEFSV